MALGDRIRKAREYLSATLGRRISRDELALMCGWNEGAPIVAYEAGREEPSIGALMTIARVTGTRIEWLKLQQGHMHDEHAAVAHGIREPEASYGEVRTDIMAVSAHLRRLMFKLAERENRGELSSEQIQSLIKLLDSFAGRK